MANFPDEFYEAVGDRGKQHRKSMASEVASLPEENIPTAAALKKRREFIRYVKRLQFLKPPVPGPFLSAEEMVREDRKR